MRTDLQEKNLFGKVKSITYNSQAVSIYSITELYNIQGFMESYTQVEVEENPNKKPIYTCEQTIVRDIDGKKLSTCFTFPSLEKGWREQYVYNKNTCIVTFYSGERQEETSEKHVFDDNGLVLEKYIYEDIEQNNLTFIENFEYKNGKLKRWLVHYKDDDTQTMQKDCEELYEYDERGNLMRMTLFVPKYFLKSVFAWLKLTVALNLFAKIYTNFKRATDYTHEDFDLHGNWLKQTKMANPPEITERKIEYWE